jgi:hypothetical protein
MSTRKRSSLLGCLMPAERVTVLFSAVYGSGALLWEWEQNEKRVLRQSTHISSQGLSVASVNSAACCRHCSASRSLSLPPRKEWLDLMGAWHLKAGLSLGEHETFKVHTKRPTPDLAPQPAPNPACCLGQASC